jgi:hypothetical protein
VLALSFPFDVATTMIAITRAITTTAIKSHAQFGNIQPVLVNQSSIASFTSVYFFFDFIPKLSQLQVKCKKNIIVFF